MLDLGGPAKFAYVIRPTRHPVQHVLCANDGDQPSPWASRFVSQIRERWPKTRIIVSGGAGFYREAIMGWCESNGIG